MSIDNIHLNGYLCQNWFNNKLVSGAKKSQRKNEASEKMLVPALGENQQKVLVIVNNADNKFLNDEDLKFLTSFLSACNLSVMDIALVNHYHCSSSNYSDFNEQFQPKKVLMFGISPETINLPFTIPYFQLQNFGEQQYLVCPELAAISGEINFKKQLWNNLKIIFSLNN
jgi:hypothetical protein